MVPFAFGRVRTEAGLAIDPVPGKSSAVVERDLAGQRQAEPDSFRLARDERFAKGIRQLGGRARPAVDDLDRYRSPCRARPPD